MNLIFASCYTYLSHIALSQWNVSTRGIYLYISPVSSLVDYREGAHQIKEEMDFGSSRKTP